MNITTFFLSFDPFCVSLIHLVPSSQSDPNAFAEWMNEARRINPSLTVRTLSARRQLFVLEFKVRYLCARSLINWLVTRWVLNDNWEEDEDEEEEEELITHPTLLPRHVVEEHVAPLLLLLTDLDRFRTTNVFRKPHFEINVVSPIAICSGNDVSRHNVLHTWIYDAYNSVAAYSCLMSRVSV